MTDKSSTSYFIYKGNPVGFEYELLSRFSKAIDVELEMVVVDNLDSIESYLETGEGDIIAANYTVTESRYGTLDFTRALLRTSQVIIQAIPEDWESFSDAQRSQWSIDSITDLAGRTVTVRKQSAFYSSLKALQSEDLPFQIETSDLSTEELIRAVSDGAIELTVADENVAVLNKTYYPNISIAAPISKPRPIAWAVRKNAPALLDTLNNWLDELLGSKLYPVIHLKYFKARSQHKQRVMSNYSSLSGKRISKYDELLKAASNRIGWDWRLLAAMIRKESNFNDRAVSIVGASGLMQLVPNTAQSFGADSVFDPTQNVHAGVSYIQAVIKRWEGDSLDSLNLIKFTLASYNAGVGHVKDAQALTEFHGGDPKDWSAVSYYLLQLSKPKYFNHPVVKYGYCRGIQPYQYVERVLGYWAHYQIGFPERK
ncbi:MAG: transporter substrate-binding domain-containing protein [Salibacteraceae bacterium]